MPFVRNEYALNETVELWMQLDGTIRRKLVVSSNVEANPEAFGFDREAWDSLSAAVSQGLKKSGCDEAKIDARYSEPLGSRFQ